MKIKNAKKNGFTLIELLVVIAIVLLLMIIVFAAIRNIREKARETVCKSNLKQLHTACITKASDSTEARLPYAKSFEEYDLYCPVKGCTKRTNHHWYEKHKGWVGWINYEHDHSGGSSSKKPGDCYWWGSNGMACVTNGCLFDLLGKSYKVFVCPSMAREEVIGKHDPAGGVLSYNPGVGNAIAYTYAMNSLASGEPLDGNHLKPSLRLLFADMAHTNYYTPKGGAPVRIAQNHIKANDSTPWNIWDGVLSGTNVANQNYPVESVGVHHDGKANAIFIDGHVEQITWDQTTNACAAKW